jgi:phenylalanyl-tRNA synthetase alpha chain
LITRLEKIKQSLEEDLRAARDKDDLNRIRVKYLGKKGLLSSLRRSLREMTPQERPAAGRKLNEVIAWLEKSLQEAAAEQQRKSVPRPEDDWIDITLPGRRPAMGRKHPITQTWEEVTRIFMGLGFDVVEGPEVELDYYNFEALNIPKDHPARDMQDTFYVSEEVLLRTHTSPVQIRAMEKHPPPISIISPGKVYRCDADITHSPMFHQVEGLKVDRQISLADLKGVLEEFVHQFFSKEIRLRFRPSYFPFTEPSAEVDISCVMCSGEGCRVCAYTGWLEILGSGMVDPEVYGFVGYDPEEWTGFAFGMGLERLAMLKYGIDDIRLFFENDHRFLEQF